MRRLAATAGTVACLVVVPILLLGAGGGGGGYLVRAIFDNASNVVAGEDVKTAGAVIGSVDSLDVTPDKRAAVVLRITGAGFSPFHGDAHCTIRPQSLIGEKFVECTAGSARAPELRKVPSGQPGAGQHLLPVTGTSSPVDLDLVNDILRLPYRQRLAIVINEFGTALAGRGEQLNQAIHRANPALRDTDRVLAILAGQNRTLAQLASEADRVLTPLAARRRQVGDFIAQANTTARATAERSADLEGSFQRLPTFLSELQPTLTQLGRVSDEMTPVLVDLDRASPSLARFVLELGPFSQAATPALRSLGNATDVGGPALAHSLPLLRRLAVFGAQARPVGSLLAKITGSIEQTGGIERIMDYLFFQMLSVNGFDGIGHYLRAELITNLCSTYADTTQPGCSANFRTTRTVGAAAPNKPNPFAPRTAGKAPASAPTAVPGAPSPTPAQTAKQRKAARERIRAAANGSPAYGPSSASDAVLNYLLGND
ncbi:MAG: MCE family protein [Actinobacteria bacterium]|nr:MCE family protein [Actinomycetota bacterium]